MLSSAVMKVTLFCQENRLMLILSHHPKIGCWNAEQSFVPGHVET